MLNLELQLILLFFPQKIKNATSHLITKILLVNLGRFLYVLRDKKRQKCIILGTNFFDDPKHENKGRQNISKYVKKLPGPSFMIAV